MSSNPQQVLEKTEKLLKKFEDPAFAEDREKIVEWKHKLETAMIFKDLSEHEGIKMILEKLKDDLTDIRFLLNTVKSDKLSELKRDTLIEKKNLYLWFLGLLTKPDEIIREVEAKVDDEDSIENTEEIQ